MVLAKHSSNWALGISLPESYFGPIALALQLPPTGELIDYRTFALTMVYGKLSYQPVTPSG